MRRFLIAFICLSTLAMAQNVVVATPAQSQTNSSMIAVTTDQDAAFAPSESLRGRELSPTSTMMLFVVGLSGLSAVGGRNRDRTSRLPA